MAGGPEPGVDQALPVIFLFMFVGVFIKQLRKYLPSWFQLPYTVLMFLFGFTVTALANNFDGQLGRVGRSVNVWVGMHPHVILFCFLPPLLFESAFDMDYNVFQRVAGQALVLAVPGVFLSLGLTACYLKAFFGGEYNWGWDICLLLGSILSATDPVAVVAVLKTLGAPKKLASLVEGESLLNDGSAFVLFLIFKTGAKGIDQSVGDIISTFAQLSLGGPAFGLLCAWISYVLLHFVYNDPLVEVTGMLVAVFTLFFVAELTFEVSSVLAVVTFGLFFAKEGKYAVSREVHHIGHAMWGQVGHISNTIIFGISGLIFYDEVFNEDSIYTDATNWGLLFLNFVMLHVVRFLVLAACFPFIRKMGYGLSWKEMAIMWFGGLRGAVGLALGLLVQEEEGVGDGHISAYDVKRINFHVAGIVCLTLLFNGTLAGTFYNKIKPYPPTSLFRIRLFKKALEVLQLEQVAAVDEIKEMWYFKGCQWSLVQDLLPNFDEIEFKHGHIELDSLASVAQCMRTARFKTLWEGGIRHALQHRSHELRAHKRLGMGLSQSNSGGVADAVVNALSKRSSTEHSPSATPLAGARQKLEQATSPSPVKPGLLPVSSRSLDDDEGEVRTIALGVPNESKPVIIGESKSGASTGAEAGAAAGAGKGAGAGAGAGAPPLGSQQSPGSGRRRSFHQTPTFAIMRKVSERPGLSVLMQSTDSATQGVPASGIHRAATSSSLTQTALRSLKKIDVHKREEVCQIIFTTVKAHYHSMYEDRYLDSAAMLMLLDSLDKGYEASRRYNEDPGNPITVAWNRLKADIKQLKLVETWMFKLSTKYSATRALRAMFVYSRAKRCHEALHAFIEAHERILAEDDYRSDLDPQVTDDVADCVKSAHELLVSLRDAAPIAAGVLTAVMAAKVVLNEQVAKIHHLYAEEGMLDEGVKQELIDLVESRLFELHSFFPSPFVLGLKQQAHAAQLNSAVSRRHIQTWFTTVSNAKTPKASGTVHVKPRPQNAVLASENGNESSRVHELAPHALPSSRDGNAPRGVKQAFN